MTIAPLVKIATYGLITLGSTGLILSYLTKQRHGNLPCTKEAITLFRGYKPGEKYIGEYTGYKIDLSNIDSFNRFFLDDTRIKINVFGRKGTGTLYLYARKLEDEGDKWLVRRLDLRVDNIDTQWKFYEAENVDEGVE